MMDSSFRVETCDSGPAARKEAAGTSSSVAAARIVLTCWGPSRASTRSVSNRVKGARLYGKQNSPSSAPSKKAQHPSRRTRETSGLSYVQSTNLRHPIEKAKCVHQPMRKRSALTRERRMGEESTIRRLSPHAQLAAALHLDTTVQHASACIRLLDRCLGRFDLSSAPT